MPLPERLGLVLGGGLFRCSFQVGVIEALVERGFRPQVVVGVSSGAWNAACLVAGQAHRMRELWMRVAEMPKVSFRNVLFNRTIFNLRRIIHEVPERFVDFEEICRSPTELYVGAARLPDLRPCFFPNRGRGPREMLAILMASNLIPGLFSWPVCIDGRYYVDGGFVDNVPFEVALRAGCARAIVVVPDHEGRILKRPFRRREQRIPPSCRSRLTVIAPRRPLHPLCTQRGQIEDAIEEGCRAGRDASL